MTIPPVEEFARMGTLQYLYADIGETAYADYLIACEKIREFGDVEYDEVLFELERLRDFSGVKVIVFIAMCFEAAIYDFASIHFGDDYVSDHLDRLDVLSKWIVVLRFVSGVELLKDKPSYGALKALVSARNALVHPKSKEIDFSDMNILAEKMQKNKIRNEKNIHNAYRALVLMSLNIDHLHNGHHNPLPSFNKNNVKRRRHYSVLKEIIGDCRSILLKSGYG